MIISPKKSILNFLIQFSYIDDIFMTTNLTIDQIREKLDKVSGQDPNIKISVNIRAAIEFLDAWIENDHGYLFTTVYHKPAAEPYILPYQSDHPRYVHANTVTGSELHCEDFLLQRRFRRICFFQVQVQLRLR